MMRYMTACFFLALCVGIGAHAVAAPSGKVIPGRYRVHRVSSLKVAGVRITPKIWTSMPKIAKLSSRLILQRGEREVVTKVRLEAEQRTLFSGYLTNLRIHPRSKGSSQRPTTQIMRPQMGSVDLRAAKLEIHSNRLSEARMLELTNIHSWGPFAIEHQVVGRPVK